ncbi:hypothetical protein PDO_3655, partial [Rhizobium sp. PDO1-076]
MPAPHTNRACAPFVHFNLRRQLSPSTLDYYSI